MKAKIEKFEDIIAWQKARELTLIIYGNFKNIRDFNFRDQIQRAVISIMNNVAEGYERRGDKELSMYNITIDISRLISGFIKAL